ncbi:proline-rich receptor-like protein kinase PERK9 [Hevea brasiliensis]|uniref:proline-rich receptor-like protein kinase PERK9 n=1 Tax=Hevea brasiliensis TaxID=3981 RepID=UPI0025ED6CAE|nr:proline-rich receptor-like protein kinase PERK9 [Hevea brasiliensis]
MGIPSSLPTNPNPSPSPPLPQSPPPQTPPLPQSPPPQSPPPSPSQIPPFIPPTPLSPQSEPQNETQIPDTHSPEPAPEPMPTQTKTQGKTKKRLQVNLKKPLSENGNDWTDFAKIREPVYKDLTLEFLSSLRIQDINIEWQQTVYDPVQFWKDIAPFGGYYTQRTAKGSRIVDHVLKYLHRFITYLCFRKGTRYDCGSLGICFSCGA